MQAEKSQTSTPNVTANGTELRNVIGLMCCQKCGGREAMVIFYVVQPSGSRRKNPAGVPDPNGWPWIGRADWKGRKVAE